MKPSNQQRCPNPLLIPAGIGAFLAGASLSVPAAATGGGPASTPFSFDLFALQTVDVRHGSISGRIAAGQGVSLEQLSSAHGPGLSPATDVLISGGDLVGTSGTVVQGNAVYGAGLALDPSTVQVLGSSRHGTVTVDPLTGSLTYRCTPGQLRPIGLREEVVEYTVQDTSGATSTPRRVRFSFEESPSGLFAR